MTLALFYGNDLSSLATLLAPAVTTTLGLPSLFATR
jgi:hypothetical protein